MTREEALNEMELRLEGARAKVPNVQHGKGGPVGPLFPLDKAPVTLPHPVFDAVASDLHGVSGLEAMLTLRAAASSRRSANYSAALVVGALKTLGREVSYAG
jgi:hypothetical protein